ncbi:hypothetical protein BDF14DRAFT_1834827 [Spinellus fusiger]|nr:hypothetical protein BDF14DRAFT_1834827 [Spinellus fusiger]
MVLCQFNTMTNEWRQVEEPDEPLARRNFAATVTTSYQTVFWGGSSDGLVGLSQDSFIWHSDIAIWDKTNGWIPSVSPYNGIPRTNASMTQIADTNGQIVILGGSMVMDSSSVDMVSNLPLADMSDIILYDPRTQLWETITATGDIPVGRKHHTTNLYQDGHTIILFGGESFNSTGGVYLLNDIYLLDTSTWTWIKPDSIRGTALYRSNHTSIIIDSQMFVIAGTNATNKAVDIQILDLDRWEWTFQSKAILLPSKLMIIGGISGLVGLIIASLVPIIAFIATCVWWLLRRKKQEIKKIQDTKETFSGAPLPLHPPTELRLAVTQDSILQPMIHQGWHHMHSSSAQPPGSYIAPPFHSHVSYPSCHGYLHDDDCSYCGSELSNTARMPSFFLLPTHDTHQKPNLIENNTP